MLQSCSTNTHSDGTNYIATVDSSGVSKRLDIELRGVAGQVAHGQILWRGSSILKMKLLGGRP